MLPMWCLLDARVLYFFALRWLLTRHELQTYEYYRTRHVMRQLDLLPRAAFSSHVLRNIECCVDVISVLWCQVSTSRWFREHLYISDDGTIEQNNNVMCYRVVLKNCLMYMLYTSRSLTGNRPIRDGMINFWYLDYFVAQSMADDDIISEVQSSLREMLLD